MRFTGYGAATAFAWRGQAPRALAAAAMAAAHWGRLPSGAGASHAARILAVQTGVSEPARLRLHQLEPSPFCDKIRRVLTYKGVPFELVNHPIAAVRRASPRTGKLPVLDVLSGAGAKDRTIDDSTAIALWIEDEYPAPALVPAEPRQRALCLALEDWADESLYFYEIAMHYASPASAARRTRTLVEREPAGLKFAIGRAMAPYMRYLLRTQGTGRKTPAAVERDVARHLATVAGLVGPTGWLVGDRLSLADIAVFCQLDLILGTPDGQRLAGGRVEVLDWCDRVRSATGG